MKKDYGQLASTKRLTSIVEALKGSGIKSILVKTSADARAEIKKIVPSGAEVMTMTSVTLDSTGIASDINDSGRYKSVRKLISTARDGHEKKRLGNSPDWAVGSVHAVTQTGSVLVASMTGSQIPAYVYGADHVIWVVGTQKIVADIEEGMDRIKKHVFPLEDARAMKAYGVHSYISKVITVNREIVPDRITIIFVEEALGF